MKQKTAKKPQSKNSFVPFLRNRKIWISLGALLLIGNTITIIVLLAHATLLSSYTFNSSFWPSQDADSNLNTPSTLQFRLSIKSATESIYDPLYYAQDNNQLVIPEARLSLPVEFDSKDLVYGYSPASTDPQYPRPAYIVINSQININSIMTMSKVAQIPCVQRVAVITFDTNTDTYSGKTTLAEIIKLSDGRTVYISTIDHEGCQFSDPELDIKTVNLLKKLTSY